MYAIVNIAGRQHRVEENKFLYAHTIDAAEGSTMEFNEVLLVDTDGKVQVGVPFVQGAKVTGKVLEHLKGDKVIVFKKKRRKGYRVKNGHRQGLTKVLIENISN
jgi:large subunit ribosomal protein L21